MSHSPFPGMDPYLEQSWRDVHHALCQYARDDIQAQLGTGLLARIDERLIVELTSELSREIYPDVLIVKQPHGRSEPTSIDGGVAVAEPLLIDVEREDHYEGFIEIIDPRGGKVITVIEFISLSNKVAAGREQYKIKQWQLLAGGANLVEVSLLRAGEPVTQVPFDLLPQHARTSYQAVIHRSWERSRFRVYPIRLRDKLPTIEIPLRQSDPPARLDLQSLIDRAYRNGAYHAQIDYSEPPRPALQGEDAEWADQLLRAAGKR